MDFRKYFAIVLLCTGVIQATAFVKSNQPIRPHKRERLQDIVTWDEHSLFVHGQRVLFYSGEFHAFRLPVPALWLDIFQKIKALGYNGVSVYWAWALLEGKQGDYSAEGVFALEPFFEAAQKAGIYILARPGPYINAEVSGGGFPGWLQRNPGKLRTRDKRYLDATENYVARISKSIAKAQITNGGPVILLQPENEFSPFPELPDPVYWNHVQKQYRDAGIVVPFINNDSPPYGYFAPGPPQRFKAAVDIYGHDGYPFGFECAHPDVWPDNYLPTNWGDLHTKYSPSTPYSIVEFQAGSFDPWSGAGFDQCSKLTGPEFQRVFYKNNYSFGVAIFNTYMIFGGTNWGNLGFPEGYSSYDYGAAISEDRSVHREKYSQGKLQANFLMTSPAYLSATPLSNHDANGSYTGNEAIATTALMGNVTGFFVLRHAAYNSVAITYYRITFPTSKGSIEVPQLGTRPFLSLHGRDSKVYVTDYDLDGIKLLYSTAEIFTWKKYGDQRVLVAYTGPGEMNELAVLCDGKASTTEGEGISYGRKDGAIILQFATSPKRRTVEIECGLTIYIEHRDAAYDYWVVENDYTPASATPIVKGGYLIRKVEVERSTINVTGDIVSTTTIEILGGSPRIVSRFVFNGEDVPFEQAKSGVVTATVTFVQPIYTVPDLKTATWKMMDSLPEIQSTYDDSGWPVADHLTTNNTSIRTLTTPTSLYAGDYGFHCGHFIYRGLFNATGAESTFYLLTQGGSAFAYSIWLNDYFVASFNGRAGQGDWNATYDLPAVAPGQQSTLTILMAMMGYTQNLDLGIDYPSEMKFPRGLLDYNLTGHAQADVKWKITGNLGGEDYQDRTRGPLNEGGLYAERQGFHLPGAPTESWHESGPQDGITAPGVAFYMTTVDLDMPEGYDIPLAFSFGNSSSDGAIAPYRAQIYVNGWQFGRYLQNIGPQSKFPVPEGIWNYRGSNYLAVALWALEPGGAKLQDFKLVAGPEVQSGYGKVEMSPMTAWSKRDGAY